MTAAPRVLNTFKDLDFVFNNPYRFVDRFNDDPDYFKSQAAPEGDPSHYKLVTNFVADLRAGTPRALDAKGMGSRGVSTTGVLYEMINGTMKSHTSEWPVGTYMNCHRHGPGLNIIILESRGYTLLWKDDFKDRVRVEYGPWFHVYSSGVVLASALQHRVSASFPPSCGLGQRETEEGRRILLLCSRR